jgi:hypothetical protein
MKIQRSGTSKLIIQKTALDFWFVLLLGNSISILALLLTAGESRLVCQKSAPHQGTCQLIRSHWSVHQTQNLQLSDLKMAKVTKSAQPDLETGNYFYTVVLQLKDRQIPFSFMSIAGSGAKAELDGVATQIDEFIDRDRGSRLDIRQGVPAILLDALGGWFVLTLIFATIFGSESFSTCVFDRERHCLTIGRKRWLRLQGVEQYPLDEIAAVELDTQDSGMGYAYRVNIKLKSGALVPLTQNYYPSDYRHTILAIEQFLHLSYPPSNL